MVVVCSCYCHVLLVDKVLDLPRQGRTLESFHVAVYVTFQLNAVAAKDHHRPRVGATGLSVSLFLPCNLLLVEVEEEVRWGSPSVPEGTRVPTVASVGRAQIMEQPSSAATVKHGVLSQRSGELQ